MGTIFVDNLDPQSGTTLTLGSSGDTVTLTSGAKTSGFGKVGQVVQTTKTDIFSSTSTSFTDVTGVTANITPSTTSSKILVTLNGSANSSQASTQIYRLKLLRGTTSIGLSGQVFESYGVSNAPQSFTTILLDEPSSTSEQTYKLQVLVSGDTVYIGGYGNAVEAPTTLTLMEILD